MVNAITEQNSTQLVYEVGTSTKQAQTGQSLKYLSINNAEGLARSLGDTPLGDSDLVSGVYEGGLKVWDCSFDLVDFVYARRDEMFVGKRVIELGCGQGLPGVMALRVGAAKVAFADFNVEVL